MQWDKLQTARLENGAVLLRPMSLEDRSQLRAIAFDPDIWRYFVTRVESENDLDQFIATALRDTKSAKRIVFSIIDKGAKQIVGSTAFGSIAEVDKRIEIGWSWLGEAFRGTGINGWVKYLMLEYAFEKLDCERVEFKTDVLNLRARQGLRNIGASEEGILRSYNIMPGNRRRDAVYYSILRGEWPAAKTALIARLTTASAAASA